MLPSTLLSVFALIAGAAFANGRVAPRSQPSPGGQCYFQCPDIDQITPQLSVSDGVATCIYPTPPDAQITCKYDVGTGNLIDEGTIDDLYDCPSSVPTTVCTTTAQGNPDSTKYFKRDIARMMESPADRRLRALQYQPNKAKARKVLEAKRKRILAAN